MPPPGPVAAGRRSVAGPTALAAAAAVTLVVTLWPRPALWLDEAQSVAIARRSPGGIVDGLRADGAPPLYYAALHVWMRLFGTGDWAVRSLSVVAALATLAAMAVTARRLFGGRAAVAAVLLTASNPFFVRYATEARMYTLVMLEVTVGVLLAERWVRGGRRGALVACGATAWALALTHYWGNFLLAASAACLLVGAARGEALLRRRLLTIAAAIGVGFAATAFWWPVLRFQTAHTGTPWTRPLPAAEAIALTLHRSTGHRPAALAVSAAVAGALVMAAVAAASPWRRPGPAAVAAPRPAHATALRWLGAVVIATWVLSFAATRLTTSAFVARYTAAMFPLQMLLAAGGLAWGLRGHRLLVAVGLVWAAGISVAAAQIDEPRTRAPGFAAVLRADAAPDDVVVYCPDQLGPPLARLLDAHGPSLAQWVFPAGAAPDRVDWIDYRQRHLDASPWAFAVDADARAGAGTIWLVVSVTHPPTEAACRGLIAALGALRPGCSLLVPDDPNWPRHDSLLDFPAASPPAGGPATGDGTGPADDGDGTGPLDDGVAAGRGDAGGAPMCSAGTGPGTAGPP